jgi:Reverse transcriptase (RNA-dependent DNA polymerase)
MPVERLSPQMDLLQEEYVLVQAWKKSASYIRAHNWYTDTLELDRTTVDLRRFLNVLSSQLRNAVSDWSNQPLRLVPAPKSQQWRVDPLGSWGPIERKLFTKLRPLAHVGFMDQVAATAVMLCLADRVETLQGDPRVATSSTEKRKRVVSYGNRLFCDAFGQTLLHRWGASTLYRAYFSDYQTFISRSEAVAIEQQGSGRTIVVHSDLKQFYDRVTPELLSRSLGDLFVPGDDPAFHQFAERLLRWNWHPSDARDVRSISDASGLTDFSSVALPQGLVASGFFANVVLLRFDHEVVRRFGTEIWPGTVLVDACRYVDDIRLVLTLEVDSTLDKVEVEARAWLQGMLDASAPGLLASQEKTRAATVHGDERPLVRQSRKMLRIQQAISGGFDAASGEDILGSIQGLVTSQQRQSDSGWSFTPVPDVRDSTVARFAAARYRKTFRSLRPLLEASRDPEAEIDDVDDGRPIGSAVQSRGPRSRAELDNDARAFALGLIDTWIADPSNVRQLRIGLDLWPAEDVLSNVLRLLRPFTTKRGKGRAQQRVAWYCLAEIFRAGATETGFVHDEECLPEAVDVAEYRAVLRREAHRLIALPVTELPWYLRQQVLLFLAVVEQPGPIAARIAPATAHYRDLIRFLRGETQKLTSSEFAVLSVLVRRSYRDASTAGYLTINSITRKRLDAISAIDPTFAAELAVIRPDLAGAVGARSPRDRLPTTPPDVTVRLRDCVVGVDASGRLRNELSLLSFAAAAIQALRNSPDCVVSPDNVVLKLEPDNTSWKVTDFQIDSGVARSGESLFAPPAWCAPGDRWRFQVGLLLRFILTGAVDVLRLVRPPSWKEGVPVYRAPESHWYQRLHGSFNGAAAFGDDWVPISGWTEQLLSALLCWPGTARSPLTSIILAGADATLEAVLDQHRRILARRGRAADLLVLPISAQWLTPSLESRPLRGCVVQTVVPVSQDFNGDPTLSGKDMRRRHRNHLSASLSAVDKMLELRATHHPQKERLDWLILPELAVHPDDVRTHLIPFAQAHKTIVLAGMAYEQVSAGGLLVNSALWVIPQRTPSGGMNVITRRQGKQHLAPLEEEFNRTIPIIASFRPCQWVVEYDWSLDPKALPLRLTAAICYDATDLCLVADMRMQSDVFAIPALNKDIVTFDQMALALHYHMFQLVVVANNGLFGGSNAYAPFRDPHRKQVFHLHGQPQASIAFFEIDDIEKFMNRKTAAYANSASLPAKQVPDWKFPPAGFDVL